MNSLVLVVAACLSAVDDPLMEKLDAEFQAMAKNDPAEAELRKAEKLLAQTNQSSRWGNYMAATRIMRQVRSKAAVPLLLKYMIPHAKFGSTGSVDTYAETIFLLTGHDVGDPFAAANSTTDRAAAVRAAVERIHGQWWKPNKDKLTTDFAKWKRPQLEAYVDRFLEKVSKARPLGSGGKPASAYYLYHIIKYDVPRSIRLRERGWFDEELHPAMLPMFLSRAGYDPDPTAKAKAGARPMPSSVRFRIIGILAKMREDGAADRLDEIARDERQGSAVRLTCVLATHVASEDLMPEVLLSVLKNEKHIELRLTAIMSLMLCRDAKLVGPTLVELLDDPHLEVRAAAICALNGSKPPKALAKLEKLLPSDRNGRYRSFLLDLIASYRNEEAIRILGEFLQTALADKRFDRDLSGALGALGTASQMRWTAAGPHDMKYYREKSEEALKWWRLRTAAIARQSAMADYKALLADYRGSVILPGDLLDAYGRFVAAAKKPTEQKMSAFCLRSVRITVGGRPQAKHAYGQDMNLPFLQDGFASEILFLRRETDDTFLIRTGSSYLRFVNTASSGWKIYDYGDKPIE